MVRATIVLFLVASLPHSAGAGALPPAPADARNRLAFTILTGTAVNIPTSLTIKQGNEADLQLNARYETRPFQRPVYYVARIGLGNSRSAWEVQFVHHKLYLTNPPPEVQHLEITHGFNVLTLNRAYERHRISFRVGAGMVLPHVSATVRGRNAATHHGLFNAGYHVTGPAFLLGTGWTLPLRPGVSLAAELQGIAGWARIPVSSGRISAFHAGFHALLGLTGSFSLGRETEAMRAG